MNDTLNVSAYHPTDRPNFVSVTVGPLQIYFSYQTPIAFHDTRSADQHEWHVRKNDWGPTTGKHLDHIDSGSEGARLAGDEFERLLRISLTSNFFIQEIPA